MTVGQAREIQNIASSTSSATHQPLIQAESILFSHLFRMGTFEVPWHQRYYDWKDHDVKALLEDLDRANQEQSPCYFLGAIMLLLNSARDMWEINDGQQRMVTVSLIIAALCQTFASESTGSQREGIALKLLFNVDENTVCTLNDIEDYPPRITPSSDDDLTYKYLIRGKTIGEKSPLTQAWREIDNYISGLNKEECENYFDYLVQRLEIACLWIPKNVDATSMFEVLNFRGKKLDDFDLIRNYLYSHFSQESELQRRTSLHENLKKIRTVIPDVKKASKYLRCYLQCKFGFLHHDRFYREFRNKIRTLNLNHNESTELRETRLFRLTEELASLVRWDFIK